MRRFGLVLLLVGCGGDDGGGGGDTMGGTTLPEATTSTTETPTTGLPADSSGSEDPEGTSSSSASDDGSSSTGEDLPPVDFEADIQPVLNARCTCHLQGPSGTMTAPYLTLNPGVSHGELVGVPATQADLDRVAPSDLGGSYMWHKLNNTHVGVGGMGTRMPPGVALPDDELALVRAWIRQGANP